MIGLALTRKLRSGRRLMLSAAAAAALATSLGLAASAAAHTTVTTPRVAAAHAAVTAPRVVEASCTYDQFVGSNLLRNANTGQYTSLAYVQLWYSSSCGTNEAIVVSHLSGTTQTFAEDVRSDGYYTYAYCGATSSCTSPSVYSPVLKDEAIGHVWAGGVEYVGGYAQPGF